MATYLITDYLEYFKIASSNFKKPPRLETISKNKHIKAFIKIIICIRCIIAGNSLRKQEAPQKKKGEQPPTPLDRPSFPPNTEVTQSALERRSQ